MNTSIALNDNRAVYRSTLLLDDDKATRTTGASNIYEELGFQRLAIVESAKALAYEFGNDAAHRQLAIAYRNLPRHDIARVSESLAAQLRQPLTASPLSPQITTDNLVILRDTGPSKVGDNEYNLLFNRNQTRAQVDVISARRGIAGDQLILSGLSKNLGLCDKPASLRERRISGTRRSEEGHLRYVHPDRSLGEEAGFSWN